LIRCANPDAGPEEIESLLESGSAIYDALPTVWGEIDDEGDGEPDPDDYGYESTEIFDVVQSWVLRRTNIRPLTNVPMLDLRYLRQYNDQGLAVTICCTRCLSNDKKQVAPLVARCVIAAATLECRHEVFTARALDVASPTTAPVWSDQSGRCCNDLDGGREWILVLEIYAVRATTQLIAWAALPYAFMATFGLLGLLSLGPLSEPHFGRIWLAGCLCPGLTVVVLAAVDI